MIKNDTIIIISRKLANFIYKQVLRFIRFLDIASNYKSLVASSLCRFRNEIGWDEHFNNTV
jgi:hypothetical protein